MKRLLLAIALAGATMLVVPAVGSGQAPAEDSVVGSGIAGGLWGFDFDAHSGPSGENPTGTVAWVHGPLLVFEGPVTCLAVAGNRAVVGMDSFAVQASLVFWIIDSPSGDSVNFRLVNATPTSCPSPLGPGFEDGLSLGSGDLVVYDAPPLPTSKDQCKKGGWQTFGVFKNQGDCVSFVATGGKNPQGS